MISIKLTCAFFAVVLALACAVPVPGGWGGHHEHVVIHVPYHVHTVHHHHVKKVHVPYPVVKKIIVHDDHHHHHDHHSHGWHGGWW